MSLRVRTALPLISFVGLGLPYGMLGPAWPSMRDTFGQSLGALGLIAVLSTVGSFAASVASGHLRDRIGAGLQLALGGTGLAISVAAFAVSPWWGGILAASVLWGIGSATLDAGMNAHVAFQHGVRMMNLLHAAFGVGATLGPAIVALGLALDTWRGPWAVVAIFLGAIAAVLWATRARWPTAPPEHFEEAVGEVVTRRRTLPIAVGLFFVGTGLEVAIGAWAYTVLVDSRGYEEGVAAAWVSAYWALFTVGRLLLGLGGKRVTPLRTVTIGALATAAGCLLFWLDPSGGGVVGLVLAGAGLSGIFPSLVSLTPIRFGASRTATAIGYQMAGATAGGAALTAVAGLVAEWASLEAIGPFLFACSLVLVGLDVAARAPKAPVREPSRST